MTQARPIARALAAAAVASLLVAAARPIEPEGMISISQVEAARAMDDFARCLVSSNRRRTAIEHFLRTPQGDEAAEIGRKLATPDCVPRFLGQTRMRFQSGLFRVSLYSALYQREFGRLGAPDVAAVPPLTVSDEFDAPASAIPPVEFFTRALGDCVARADAPAVHALLLTRIDSKEEKPALDRVMPRLAYCLPAGQQLKFSRTMLRGYLAEALYKLRKAASAPVPAPASAPSSARPVS